MRRKILISLAFVFMFLSFQTGLLLSQTITPPWLWSITSDYGPRMLGSTWNFHGGIDYDGGIDEDIYAVEGGTINSLGWDSKANKYIAIQGSHGRWAYIHIFSAETVPVVADDWEMRMAKLIKSPSDIANEEEKEGKKGRP